MKLHHLLVQLGLFSKIDALADIMQKGVLDYVAHNHAQN